MEGCGGSADQVLEEEVSRDGEGTGQGGSLREAAGAHCREPRWESDMGTGKHRQPSAA